MNVKKKESLKFNPFSPGAGIEPPFLAGRNEDLDVFSGCIAKLKNGKSVGPIVLFGPRGSGKTVLANEMRRRASEGGAVCKKLSPSAIRTREDVIATFAHALSDSKVLQEEEKLVNIKAILKFFGAERGTRKKWDAEPKQLSEVLEKASQERHLVITIDEAHTLTKEAGQTLLQAEQEASGDGAKVLLILAGTPDLKDHMGGMGTTFWDRLDDRLRHINLLNRDDAADAIETPFRKTLDITIDEDAKDSIFELTSGHPYFLQLMGKVLWRGQRESAKTITREAVDAAEPEFLDGKNDYYMSRRNELENAGMLGAAFAVATAHKKMGEGGITTIDMGKAAQIGSKLGVDLTGVESAPATDQEMIRFLLHKSFMWQPTPRSMELEPGIPTLMDFVREKVLKRTPTAEARLLENEEFQQLIEGVALAQAHDASEPTGERRD